MVAAGEFEMRYVKMTGQPADMMTKRLVEKQHWKCCNAGDGGAGAGGIGSGAGSLGAGGTVQRRPFFVPPPSSSLPPPDSVLCQVLIPLPSPPSSSLADGLDSESHLARAASPTFPRLLATVVIDPSFESTDVSALDAELVEFAATCHLDNATSLVADSESDCPPSIGGECALGTDVLQDRQEDFECLAIAAITGPYSSQWQTAMDAEMASWKSTDTYIGAVPPYGENIVNGMWIFRVKQPPGSPTVFKASYVARGFTQRRGVDFFQNLLPYPKDDHSLGSAARCY
ncbi:unnamed protein product [Closterium sp. NIES-53]